MLKAMAMLAKTVRRVGKSSQAIARFWRLKEFAWTAAALLRWFELGEGNKVDAPLRCDGRGILRIGKNNLLGYRLAPRLGSGEILLQPRDESAVIEIGEENVISNNVSIVANERVVIGNGCQIGEMVVIYDCDFHEIDPATRNRSHGKTQPVQIGNNVWLGSRVMVLKGVIIGDNSVIAAGSIVTRSIPANCVAAGSPARVIRQLG